MPNEHNSGLRRTRPLPGRPATRGRDRQDNRTATAGLELLQAIARMKGPATLSEIAQAVGRSVTTTSRYLASLRQADFLDQDEGTGKYDLGPAAIELGAAAMSRIDAVRLASELMRDLTARTHLVSILAVWGTGGPILIRWEQSVNDIAIRVREGLNLSVVATAAGRIFLAYQHAAELRPVLRRDLRAWNATAVKSQRFSRRQIDDIRKAIRHHGLAYAGGLNNPVLAALAAPVFGPDRRLVLSLALAGMIGSFDPGYSAPAAIELRQTAMRLTRMLGGATVCD